MDKQPTIIIDDANIGIKIIEDAKLNHLFNLSYNFDILKSAISMLFKNQENLLKKIDKAYDMNNEQKKYIESLEKYIKDNCTTKKETKKLMSDLNTKITQINDALAESNLI